MSHLLRDLDIDAICDDFLTRRIAQLGGKSGQPQPIVEYLDAPPDPDEGWEEVTARAAKLMATPGTETTVETVERILRKAI
jgi:hypothetical protein